MKPSEPLAWLWWGLLYVLVCIADAIYLGGRAAWLHCRRERRDRR